MRYSKNTRLSPRQKRFVQEYLADPTLNATNAIKKAGYTTKHPDVAGSQLLRNVKVRKAIQEAMEAREARTHITQDRVLQEYARIAFVDPRKLVDDEGVVKKLCELDEDTARAISDVDIFTEWEKDKDDVEHIGTKTKIKVFDKRSALDSIGKHLGMFIDRKEVGRPGDYDKLTEEELDRRIAEQADILGITPGKKLQGSASPTKELPPIH